LLLSALHRHFKPHAIIHNKLTINSLRLYNIETTHYISPISDFTQRNTAIIVIAENDRLKLQKKTAAVNSEKNEIKKACISFRICTLSLFLRPVVFALIKNKI